MILLAPISARTGGALAAAGLTLGALLLPIGLDDADQLLSTGSPLSAHFWLATFGGSVPLALVALNALFLISSVMLLAHLRLPAVLFPLLINPFAVANTLDAFNRYALTLFLFSCAAHLSIRAAARWPSLIASLVCGMMHPINLLGTLSAIRRFVMVVGSVVVAFLLIDALLGQLATIAPDKLALWETFGLDLAEAYGGNFRLAHQSHDSLVSFMVFRLLAVLFFPLWLDRSVSIFDWLLCIFLLAGHVGFVVAAVKTLPPAAAGRALFLLAAYLVITATFVGNLAVIYRHLGPLLPALFVTSVGSGLTSKRFYLHPIPSR